MTEKNTKKPPWSSLLLQIIHFEKHIKIHTKINLNLYL